MRKLGIIGLLWLILGSVKAQEYKDSQALFFRSQPLALLSHRSIPFELDYFLSPQQSISLGYTYSAYNKPGENAICVRCWLTDYADSRHLISFTYRYYTQWGIFFSPYLRYRIWNGELASYVQETLAESGQQKIRSKSFGAGIAFGALWKLSDIFQITFHMGLGSYFSHSYPLRSYTMSYELEQDLNLGFNLGVRICE